MPKFKVGDAIYYDKDIEAVITIRGSASYTFKFTKNNIAPHMLGSSLCFPFNVVEASYKLINQVPNNIAIPGTNETLIKYVITKDISTALSFTTGTLVYVDKLQTLYKIMKTDCQWNYTYITLKEFTNNLEIYKERAITTIEKLNNPYGCSCGNWRCGYTKPSKSHSDYCKLYKGE